MTGQTAAPNIMNLEELLAFRETTERISAFLNKRLKDHLSALASLLSPGRVLGKHVGARDAAPRADEALSELTARYKEVSAFPYDLKPELEPDVLTAISSAVQIYPYEYTYEAQGAKASKKITMTSPIRWVVAYGSELSVSQVRLMLLTPGDHRSIPLRQAVVNLLAFDVVLNRLPTIRQLLKDLRYETSVEALPGLEKLPLVVFSLALPSFRPADDLLLTAVRLSGVPAFIELIDTGAIHSMTDPLRADIERLSQG
jgi:hypothetical protein